MTKKISISVPDLTYIKFQKWAKLEGTSMSDLASYLLRRELEKAEKDGIFPREDLQNLTTAVNE